MNKREMNCRRSNLRNRNNGRFYSSTVKKNSYLKVLILSLSIMFVLIFSGIIIVEAGDNNKAQQQQYKYYTSISIEKDDTLWSIASNYVDNTADIATYVEEIKALNKITSDCIYQGQSLIVYYYSSETI